MTYVTVGSVVKAVYWETVPDKYQPPRKFAVRAEAAKYAEENALWFDMYVHFDDGQVVQLSAAGGESAAEDLHPGDVVLRESYRIQEGRVVGTTVYPDLAAATAAAPAGQRTGIYQTVWVGPKEHELVGASGSVDKT
ncbi:hypothetical protein GCM10009745_13140 [Kribbella yunnanensis]|uniref:Uncharacterized protein n=1 Tax=Kribbella yunnanensis TaxID=190194 RepID=A0ABN2GIH7_9ACTN